MLRPMSLVALFLIFAGCRNEGGQKSETAASSSDQSVCANAQSPSLNLINGRTTSQFRSVVLLGAIKKVGNSYKRSTCTGTFVGPNVILTAAHCIDGTTKGGLTYIAGDRFDALSDFMAGLNKGIEPKQAVFAGKFGESMDPNVPEDRRQDMALLIMPDNIAPAITPILDHAPADKNAVTLVGFGATSIDHPQDSLALAKRYGYNQLRFNYPGISGGGLFISGRSTDSAANGAAQDSMSAPGDSGGPMFVDGAVAGVTTGGFVDPVDPAKAVAVYLDLNNTESRSLVQKAKQQGALVQLAAKGPIESSPFSSQGGCSQPLALSN